jgi:transposase-like protein
MKEKAEMIGKECCLSEEKKIGLTIGGMRLELNDYDNKVNRKVLSIIGRQLKYVETGKPVYTHQAVADQIGYADRRNVQNFTHEFEECDGDLQKLISRQNSKEEQCFPKIEEQILESPFLSVNKHYSAFIEAHPELSISASTFNKYVNKIDSIKLLRRVRHLVSKEKDTPDVSRYVKELLSLPKFSCAKKKEIVDVFPEVKEEQQSKSEPKALELSTPMAQKKLLVVLLYVCNVSQEMLSLLFGVGKTSIHNYVYALCSQELDWQILRSIVCWSGKVSFDEKWVRIDGSWHFVLCAVDSVSGFPLLIELYSSLDSVNWTLFFKHFKSLYGMPKLITSDGSQPLAIARELVFKGVRYQLCKFHKLKNLMKRLRQHVHDPKLFRRCVGLAKHIFSNKFVSSRKYAAKTLQELAGEQVSSYIDGHILKYWRKLTMSLTNNASERFNRKIEKCFSGRYGIPSVESAEVLLRGLWLKELLLNGQKHLDVTSELTCVDLSRICQEHLDTGKILQFFHDNDPSQVEKYA